MKLPRCPVCKKTFLPRTSWQKYDRAACKMKAFRRQQKEEHDGKTRQG